MLIGLTGFGLLKMRRTSRASGFNLAAFLCLGRAEEAGYADRRRLRVLRRGSQPSEQF
jgi:hypothetical protein